MAAGIAKYDGEREEVSIRVAKAGNGYAIDLCDAEWRCAIVEPGAWRIASPPSPPYKCRFLKKPEARQRVKVHW
ncbi:hypothetical protein [Methylomagnum ishizawai]|uniref:hypothetical protein n=1 Tax=Methylomagnum ishizawai TaxID=1760988 RepID=UPI001C33F55F|nr:hypothetical protein [Methylomagnum ishizawai]BBL75054.1 hypothetical protein MishRS11D_21520 [Methylomagnum ishizawai]